MLAKLLCTKRKSASAPRCLRCLGATIDIVNSITRTANRSGQGGIFASMFTKGAVALKPRCEENRVIMGLYHLPSTQPAWTRREPGGAHENPETIIRPTALDLST